MRVIFVNRFFHPDHSATSQMLSDLCFGLAGTGDEIEVLTSRLRYDDPAANLPKSELVAGVRVHRVWTSRFGRQVIALRALDYLTFYLSVLFFLLAHLRRDDVVVAKTDPPLLSVIVGAAARLRRARLVNWLQDVFPEVAVALGMRAIVPLETLVASVRNLSLRAAAMNVVIGHRMAEVVGDLGVSRDRITVIPNWADGRSIRPLAAADHPLRSAWNLDRKFVIGYSGNMGRAHDFETLLGAIPLLRDEPEICFLFIGGGAQRQRLEQALVGSAGAGEDRNGPKVVFKPYQPREMLGQSLTVADVHLVSLIPSLEGLIVPSKFYGILAAGRPTLFVGDPDGEVARVVRGETNDQDSQCGCCIAAGDAEGLAAAIRRLAGDAGFRERLGRNARRVFEERYDQPIQIERWREVLVAVDKVN